MKPTTRVMCIDNSTRVLECNLDLNRIYPVEQFVTTNTGARGIVLVGHKSPGWMGAYHEDRFCPVDESFTDETISELNKHFETLKVMV